MELAVCVEVLVGLVLDVSVSGGGAAVLVSVVVLLGGAVDEEDEDCVPDVEGDVEVLLELDVLDAAVVLDEETLVVLPEEDEDVLGGGGGGGSDVVKVSEADVEVDDELDEVVLGGPTWTASVALEPSRPS